MPGLVVEAVYENGVLRLAKPIDLAEGTRVEVVVTPSSVGSGTAEPGSAESAGSAAGRRTPAEVAAGIAALASEATGSTFSGRDHDRVLYGEDRAR